MMYKYVPGGRGAFRMENVIGLSGDEVTLRKLLKSGDKSVEDIADVMNMTPRQLDTMRFSLMKKLRFLDGAKKFKLCGK